MTKHLRRVALPFLVLLAGSGCGGSSSTPKPMPGLAASPTTVGFSMQYMTGLPPAQEIAITADAAGVVLSVAGGLPDWLNAGPISGARPNWTLPVSIASAQIPVGSYDLTFRITAVRADASAIEYRDIPVRLVVTNDFVVAPLLNDPMTLLEGNWQFGLVALGGVGFAWTAEADQPWISLAPAAGVSPGNVQVQVDGSGLSRGSHLANVVVTETVSGKAHTVPVHVEVVWGYLVATPNPAVLVGKIGVPVPPVQVALAMSSGITVSWKAYTDTPWLHLNPASGSLPGTLTLSVDSGAPTAPVNSTWYWVSFDGGATYQGMGAELDMSP